LEYKFTFELKLQENLFVLISQNGSEWKIFILVSTNIFFSGIIMVWGKAVATYPQELAQDAACQNHTGRLTRLWFLPNWPKG
jgi:hypothetical protein